MAAAEGRQGDDANDENATASDGRSDDDEQGQGFCNRIRKGMSIINTRSGKKKIWRLMDGWVRTQRQLFHRTAKSVSFNLFKI